MHTASTMAGDGTQVQGSPMSTLHPDILEEIFEHCEGMFSIYIEDPQLPLHYTLSKVCRKWHETVHSCPLFWRKLGINFNDEAMAGTKNVQIHTLRLEKCLRSSGNLGLILELRYDPRESTNGIPPFLKVAANKLGEHSDRWAKLDFRPSTPAFLLAFGAKAVKSIPRLHSLTLDFVCIPGPLEDYLPWCDATKLKTISLTLTALDDVWQPRLKHIIPWWQITNLSLYRCFIPHRELRQLLDRTPVLQQLIVSSGEAIDVTRKITPVSLQHLETLIFKPPQVRNSDVNPGLNQIFDLLDCPGLRSLSIEPSFTLPTVDPLAMLPSGLMAQDVLEFVRRTGCKLETLSLLMPNMDDVKTLILEIPSLIHLDMTNPIILSDVWERLADILIPTFTLEGMYIPAPNLQALSFTVVVAGHLSESDLLDQKKGMEYLVEMLEYRMEGSPFLPVYDYPPIRGVMLNEKRHRFRGDPLPKYCPEVYEPLLTLSRKHRLKTSVNVWVDGRIEFYEVEGLTAGSVKADTYKTEGDLERYVYNCYID